MSQYLIRKYAKCQNCKKVQNCNKSNKHNNNCSEIELINEVGEKPTKGKHLCSGCYNDYYNQGNKKTCYNYKNSKVILKSVWYSNSQRPPWALRWKLSCWRR